MDRPRIHRPFAATIHQSIIAPQVTLGVVIALAPSVPETHSRLIGRLAASELPLVILIAPLLLFPTPTRLLPVLLVPVVWLCHWRVSGRLIPSTPLNTSLFLLLVMVAVSLAVTFDVEFS